MVDISIIVAFDNNSPLMRNYIDEVIPFIEGREDRELVLAADRCLDIETLEFARECDTRWDNVHLHEIPDKVGYSRANNYAVEHSNGRYLLLMNTDIFAEPGSIEALRSEFDADPKLGAAQGRLLYPQSGKVMSTGHCFGDYMNHHLYDKAQSAPSDSLNRAGVNALG
jgi:GT2 family glycosyltransferase